MQAILDGPAAEPPRGFTANFDNPPNSNVTFFFFLILCQTVATLVVLIRLYTKWFLLHSIMYEDCKSCWYSTCITM